MLRDCSEAVLSSHSQQDLPSTPLPSPLPHAPPHPTSSLSRQLLKGRRGSPSEEGPSLPLAWALVSLLPGLALRNTSLRSLSGSHHTEQQPPPHLPLQAGTPPLVFLQSTEPHLTCCMFASLVPAGIRPREDGDPALFPAECTAFATAPGTQQAPHKYLLLFVQKPAWVGSGEKLSRM